ncbi:MAG: decarboxylating 6-phosphogluconate dehydrogenase [Humibacillus sp.]|nr:decarboxylating 6-phosphogluconate dehydrogenase [Humibacillus sp.]MDN5778409.1 decarboxylating 6-phosphogluconate dehydrogenase [Humibacillus sp.]
MQLGLIGLGKMGGNMRERLRRAGHEVVGYDRNPDVADVRTMAAMVKKLEAPRVVWVMVPSGDPTRETIAKLSDLLEPGDLVIDGGNSRFTDDFENAKMLAEKKIGYVDCGVSGGIWGLENGYGLMCGGDKKWVTKAMPIFDALRPEGPRDEGFVHAGKVGAGHYTKMVHNGIEYGLMAAYAEGFELLEKKDIVTDVPGAFKAWSRGTVVRSWLLDLMVDALEENPHLDDVSDYTNDSGEGRWTVEEAIALSVPMPVISASLFARFASRQQSSPTMQAVAALRGGFGGHQVMTIAEGEKLREGDVPTRSAKKESAPTQAKKRASAKKASSASAAVASKANVGAARKAATSKRAPATQATDMADTARGQVRAAKAAPARKTAKRAAKKA